MQDRTTELRRQKPILSLALPAQELEHLLHERLGSLSFGHLRQLKSRHPFVTATLELPNDFAQLGSSVVQWADYKWNMGWWNNTSRLHSFIADVSSVLSRMSFPRPARVRLNCLRTGLDYSAQQRTNGVWFLLRLVSVAQRSNQLST